MPKTKKKTVKIKLVQPKPKRKYTQSDASRNHAHGVQIPAPPEDMKETIRPYLTAGQPTKLTMALIDEVAELLPRIMFMETVGELLDVERFTWTNWVKIGRKMRQAIELDPGLILTEYQELCMTFYRAYKWGLAQSDRMDNENIARAAVTDWRAAVWRRVARNPKRYSQNKTKLELTGPKGAEIQGVTIVLPDNGRDKPINRVQTIDATTKQIAADNNHVTNGKVPHG
jgi:hypothetical protein